MHVQVFEACFEIRKLTATEKIGTETFNALFQVSVLNKKSHTVE